MVKCNVGILLIALSTTISHSNVIEFHSINITRHLRSDNEVKNYAPHIRLDDDACVKAELLGKENGGGWFICTDAEYFPATTVSSPCIVYSYGLGADWSFDNTLESKYKCQVHGFDPSGRDWKEGMYGHDYSFINYTAQYPSQLKAFHNWGIGAADIAIYPPGTIPQEWPGLGDPPFSVSNSDAWVTKSIQQTLIDLGHYKSSSTASSSLSVTSSSLSLNYLSILKIDVEGAEWDAITAFLETFSSELQQGYIKQLLVEWHWDPSSTLKNSRHSKLLRRLRMVGFRPWKVVTHKGSECCLDVSYVWSTRKSKML